MWTDRQQKFYQTISTLETSNQVTEMEKENLIRAKKWFDRGDDFHTVINSLDLGLQALETERLQGKLTPEVKTLFEELKEAYGEPKESTVRIGGGAFIRFLGNDEESEKKEGDEPYIRESKEQKKSFGNMIAIVRTILFSFLAAIIIGLLVFTPIISWLNNHLGKVGIMVMIVTIFVIWVTLLALFGKVKKNNLNNKK